MCGLQNISLQFIMSVLQQCRSSMDNKPHMLLHQPIQQHFPIRFRYCDFEMINYYEDGHLDHAHLRTDFQYFYILHFASDFFSIYCWIQLGRFCGHNHRSRQREVWGKMCVNQYIWTLFICMTKPNSRAVHVTMFEIASVLQHHIFN